MRFLVVSGTAGPVMALTTFWQKQVLVSPLFLWPNMFLDRVSLLVNAGSVHRVIGLCHDQSLHRSLFRLPQGVKGGRYKNRIKKWTPMLITVNVKGMDYVPPPPR